MSNDIKRELENLEIDSTIFESKIVKAKRIFLKMKNKTTDVKSLSRFTPIESIQIKNFKGFGSCPENEDQGILIKLHKDKNIFFAPNGGGKTSLCEAFEYKLTNNIKEAVRRGMKPKDYFKRGNEKEIISLNFIDNNINVDALTENERNLLGNCMIEKKALR